MDKQSVSTSQTNESQTALSRIGKQPITIPNGVTVEKNNNVVNVKGPKGELSHEVFDCIDVSIQDNIITVTPKDNEATTKAKHGLMRSLINNMVVGVSEGFKKELEIQGVGYRVSQSGKSLKLSLGYSHESTFEVPEGIDVAVEGLNITVTGFDKQQVGQVAAEIRALRKPEPYKGKGIRYKDENIIRKAGKTAA